MAVTARIWMQNLQSGGEPVAAGGGEHARHGAHAEHSLDPPFSEDRSDAVGGQVFELLHLWSRLTDRVAANA